METDAYIFLGILILLLLLLTTVLAYAVYSGLFLEIEVKSCRPDFQSLTVAYKFAQGVYRESSELFTEAHVLAPDLHCIGIYYDDPRKDSPTGLRYIVGVIVNDGKLSADKETLDRLTKEGYACATFPAVDYVVTTTFPFKGTLSIMIAIARVYPVLAQYIKEHKLCAYPFIEIYADEKIHFIAPLAKQDEFYVDEAKDVHSKENEDENIEELSQNASICSEEDKCPENKAKNDSEDSTSSFEELNAENY